MSDEVDVNQSDDTISSWTREGLPEQVILALAQSRHLLVKPSQLEDVEGYSTMIGGFGTVRVARMNNQLVAVKEIRVTGAPADRARFSMRFARELRVWAPLDHPNLLKLSGYYMNSDMSIAQFICPFYAHGHIGEYIDTNKPSQDVRLKFAKDTAEGLKHLHGLHIVHGDLKDLNVLVDPEPRALLCDFGLSRMVNPEGVTTGLTTTGITVSIRYASPELMNGSRQTIESDMWAWACLFLEIVTDVSPYTGITDLACMIRIAQGIAPADVSALDVAVCLREMLEKCWNRDPSTRPGISQCITIMESARPRSDPLPSPPLSPEYKTPQPWEASSDVSITTLGGHEDEVRTVAFAHDGTLLASGSGDRTVRMWDLASGTLITTLEGHSLWVRSLAFSPTGVRIATGTANGQILIWDTISESKDRQWTRTFSLSMDSAVLSLSFSPDGLRLASGLRSGLVQVWDASSGTLFLTLNSHTKAVQTVAFSPEGRWLASGSWDGTVRIWDAVGNGPSPASSEGVGPVMVLEGHLDWVWSVAFSPNGRWLASGSADGTIRIWDTASWTLHTKMDLRKGVRVYSVAFSPDGTRLALGTDSNKPQILDTASWTRVMTLDGHTSLVHSVAFSPDGSMLASGSYDETVRIWHAKPKLPDTAP